MTLCVLHEGWVFNIFGLMLSVLFKMMKMIGKSKRL